ncbi:hypothetical protein EC890511_1823, partial [Escherichia coli 89.0511]
CIHNQFPLE